MSKSAVEEHRMHLERLRKVATGEITSAQREEAAERMVLNRPATAAKLNYREMERLVRMLLITSARMQRHVLAFAVYHRRPSHEVAKLLNLGDRRADEVLRAIKLRLNRHERDLKRDAMLRGLPALTKGQGHA